MVNTFLKPLYRNIYGEDFDYHNFGKRMKMQKCIYLIEQLGLNVGSYHFSWYKHGPYSQRLLDDMYDSNGQPYIELEYSVFASNVISRVKEMTDLANDNVNFGYSEEQWMECLASVHYLNRIFHGNKEQVLQELVRRKPHLDNKTLNDKAYNLVIAM